MDDLREIAEHDPVVAQHFQGFDYEHAHLVTVSEKQLMYVAYRTGRQGVLDPQENFAASRRNPDQ